MVFSGDGQRLPHAVPRGVLITFEGGEGSGKSTQVRCLVARLAAAGADVVATREPGGSAAAERIRTLLLTPADPPFSPLTEAILHNAARCEHVITLIKPALASGRWVVCDRFADSTLAYQGDGMGVDRQTLLAMQKLVTAGVAPDLTFILDLAVETGLARAARRNPVADRYQHLDVAFHRRVREGFLAIARREPHRCVVIDATAAEEVIADQVFAIVDRRFGRALHPG